MTTCINCMKTKTGRFIQADINKGTTMFPAMVPICEECWNEISEERKSLWTVLSEFIEKGDNDGV